MKNLIIKAKDFVLPYYNSKDIMHSFAHIERFLKIALKIWEKYKADKNLIILGAYFHWVIWQDEEKIREFLSDNIEDKDYIEKIIKVSWDSQKDVKSEILEWIILRDAHLLEWWKNFLITKSLVTWTSRWQTLDETITYIKNNVIWKYECYLKENISKYKQKEKFAIEYIKDLEENL